MRVLIVEDDRDTASVFASLLETNGHDPLAAPDGETALELVQREAVDAVLLDLGLPGLSGFETCRRLKQLPSAPVVIAVSGWSRPSDRAAASEAGCDHFLIKPVSFTTIADLLSAHASRADAGSGP